MKQLFTLLIVFFILACSKKDSQQDASQSNTEKLINKKWKISALSGKLSNGTIFPDEYTGLPAYMKDDYWYFKSDLTYTYNDNTVKRPGNLNDIMDFGTWSLINGDLYIQLISTAPQPPGSTITYFPTKFLQLTSTTLKWESTDPSAGTIIWSTYTPIQ